MELLEDRAVPAIDLINAFGVSQFTGAQEWYPTSSIDNNGNMIFSYLRSAATTSPNSELWFRILNPQGFPVAEAPNPVLFQNNVQSASVAAYRDREFALIWTANEVADAANASDVVYTQRFTRNGVGIGAPVALARSTTANTNVSFLQPTIDSTPNGDLVFAWRERNSQVTTGDVINYSRWASTIAAPVAAALAADDVDVGAVLAPPALAVNDSGDFIIAWTDQENADGSGPVRFRRFTATGAGAAIQLVNNTGFSADVDIANDRSFVVTWHDEVQNGDDQISFQRYNSNGQTLGGQVNIAVANLPATQPNVVVTPNGGPFMIAFSDDAADIELFQFNQNGTPVNNQPFFVAAAPGPDLFTDGPATTFHATMSQMTINGSGDYVVTWFGLDTPTSFGVFASNFLGPRTISIADAQVEEGDGVNVPMTFTVTLDNPAAVPIQIRATTTQLSPGDSRLQPGQVPAISGVDFVPLVLAPVTIQAGQTTATFNVQIIGDLLIEPEEVFAVDLTNPDFPSVTLDPDSALGTIIDNDTPAVTVSNGVPDPTTEPAAPPIGNLTPMTFTISISKTPTLGNLVLNYRTVNGTATAGQDFVNTAGTVTFLVGTAVLSQNITVNIRGDGISEPEPPARTTDPNFVETFTVVVETAPTNANPVRLADPVGVGNIRDSQPAQMIFPTPFFSTPEGDAPNIVPITILLNKPATVATTVTVTTSNGPLPNPAIAGVDYTAIPAPPPNTAFNTINIAPGQTQFTINVEILGNLVPERDRDFLVNLTVNPAQIFLPGGIGITTQSFTVRILDDDGIEVFLVDVSDSMETVRAQDINGDGILNGLDDLNNDGQKGTLIDQAINQVSQSFANSLQRRGSLIIFGRDASILDMDPAAGFQPIILKGAGVNDQGLDIFNQVLRTVQLAKGGLYSESTIDPSRTFYEYALPELFNLGVAPFIIARATIVTDGSGLLAAASPALASVVAAGIPVSAIVLGPYANVGSTTDIDAIVAATGGSRQNVNQDLIPASTGPAGNTSDYTVQLANVPAATGLNLLGPAVPVPQTEQQTPQTPLAAVRNVDYVVASQSVLETSETTLPPAGGAPGNQPAAEKPQSSQLDVILDALQDFA